MDPDPSRLSKPMTHPPVRLGQVVTCEVRGDVTVFRISDTPTPGGSEAARLNRGMAR